MAVILHYFVFLTGLITICEGQRHGSFEGQYRGCYADRRDRALESRAYIDTSGINSNGRCIRNCGFLGFTFAGTVASLECYCGNRYDYDRHGFKPDQCTINCRGSTNETCGGYWRIQIYSVCPSGKYKGEGDPVINDEPNCENECHCNDELPCFFTNGTCKNGCAIGWRGITCNERDCEVENGGCQYQCTEDKRDEWCSCDEGFDISPNDWRECIDIDECAGERGEVYNKDCHTCVNTNGSYTCGCGDGYELDSATNQTCIDMNECLGETGVDYDKDCHECINSIGSYTCRCDHGYELLPSGTSCRDVDECERGMYDVDRCHTCVNLIGGHTCLCNDTYTLDTNNSNETCIDPSKLSSAGSSIGIIIGLVFALFLLIAAAVAVACLIKKRRRAEKNAYTSAKVPDSEKMEPNEYEELQGSTPVTSSSSQSHPNQQSSEVTSTSLWAAVLSLFKGKGKREKNPKQSEVPTNTSCKSSDVNVPEVEILDENEYEEIRDISIKSSPSAAATKQTPDVTYYNTSGKHPTMLDNSASDGNSAISQFEEIRQKINLSKTAKPMPKKPDEKLDFVQVDSFGGKWSFFAFQCPKGNAAVGRFWRLVVERQIKNVVFLDDASIKVLPAVGGSMFDDIKVFCKKEWQNKGIKKFTVTFNNEELSERAEYVNQQSGISVQTTDNELTNKVIINLRQNLIPFGRSPKCAIMCKDGTQFSGFFISVSCTLDMVDEGNKMDSLYGLHKFKTVRPDFAPSEEQHLQLSHLAKDYISHGQKNN